MRKRARKAFTFGNELTFVELACKNQCNLLQLTSFIQVTLGLIITELKKNLF